MPVPIISIAQMREWEAESWRRGRSEADVIRRVGRAVAECAVQLTQAGDLVVVLAGRGNNGADARAALEHFDERLVDSLDLNDPDTDLPDLETLLALRPALIIDGLFGIGINRPLDPAWTRVMDRINAARLQVLSIDVPSGLNADTGEPCGAAIESAVTLTVGAPKTGLLSHAASRYVGRLEVADDIGLIPCPKTSEHLWTLTQDFDGFPARRRAGTHKGDYGHVGLLAGSVGYHGAAVLAARGAQCAQPGLITLFTHPSAYNPAAAQLQAVMVQPWTSDSALPGDSGAILAGPGLAAPAAQEMKPTIQSLWSTASVPFIADASALPWLEGSGPAKAIRVITPHPGEAARLLNSTAIEVQADRFKALRELSQRFGDCWVVLKGNHTLIGRHTGEIFVNSSGNPHLAQGGSGDTLAGYLAGLLAQPALQTEVATTLRYAVWQHGVAADRLQRERRNWVVEDLIPLLGTSHPHRAEREKPH